MQHFHLLIAGGTGFIGQALIADRLKRGDHITVLGRSIDKIKHCYKDSVKALTWKELHAEKLSQFDVVINLAGENIGDKRWSKERKAIILKSRTVTTQRLADLCAELAQSSPRLLNASAIGIYGVHPKASVVNESAPIAKSPFPDFLTEVGVRWEEATQVAKIAGVNVVNLRFGVVLGSTGGMLKKLRLPFQLGLGHIIGNGEQKISWVSLADVINSIDIILNNKKLSGPINIVSPNAISQGEFAKTLAEFLHRPCWLTFPKPLISFLFGEMGEELLLGNQCVAPKVLTEYGYHFVTPTLADCLAKL